MAVEFDLKAPWPRQIEFFRQKLNLPTEAWDDITGEAHDRAFVVAGVMKADMLEDFRQAVDKSIAEGKSIGWFRKEFNRIVAETGWDYNGPKNWRTRVIYQTNLQASYHAGRYQQLSDPELLQVKPYWVYHHGHPITPRPEHLGWDGIALPASDPWWQTHYTPNGYGCTCWVSAASAREIERKGYRLLDQAPDDGTYDYVDKKTGEVHVLPRGVDYGWNYAPGASVAEQLRPMVDSKLAAWPASLGQAVMDDMPTKIFKNSLPKAGQNTETTQAQELPQALLDELLSAGIDPNSILHPEPDDGIITDGLCDTPEAQAKFDQHQKGRPPISEP